MRNCFWCAQGVCPSGPRKQRGGGGGGYKCRPATFDNRNKNKTKIRTLRGGNPVSYAVKSMQNIGSSGAPLAVLYGTRVRWSSTFTYHLFLKFLRDAFVLTRVLLSSFPRRFRAKFGLPQSSCGQPNRLYIYLRTHTDTRSACRIQSV